MKSNFSRLWKISSIVYKELCFQSVFSLRLGAIFPRMDEVRIWRLVNQAKTNMLISKALMTIFIIIMAAVSIGYSSSLLAVSGLSEELVIAVSVSIHLASVFFLIFMVGLQVTTSLVSTKAFEMLAALPISRRDVSKVAFLSFFRIFDFPLVAALITFPVFYSVFKGSFLGGLTCLMAVAVTESFALALTVALAKLFYSKITGGAGGSKYRTIMRFFYMLVWLIPMFGVYFITNFAVQLFQFLSSSFAQVPAFLMNILALIYPFSLGFLVSFATFPGKLSYPLLFSSLFSSFIYLAIAYFGMRYTGVVIRRICTGGVILAAKRVVKEIFIRPSAPWLGIILKDLRVASRTPAYASVFLLPVVQTVVIVASFLSGNIHISEVLAISLLGGLSFFTLIVTPTIFMAETLASAYTRSLPLRRRTVIIAKATLTTLIYLISTIAISTVLLLLGRNFMPMLVYGLAHAFSVAAASITMLALMMRKFWMKETIMSNIYTGLITFITTMIPGMVVALTPIVIGVIAYFLVEKLTPLIFVAVAAIEFLTAVTLTGKMKN